jgi:hypothetical protein
MRPRLPLLLLLFLLAVGLTQGCGGDSETSSLSKEQYLEKANNFCSKIVRRQLLLVKNASEKLARVPGDPSTVNREKLFQSVQAPFLDSVGKMILGLAELGTPAEDGDEAEAVVGLFQQTLTEVQENPKLALSGAFQDANDSAEAYGLKECRV